MNKWAMSLFAKLPVGITAAIIATKYDAGWVDYVVIGLLCSLCNMIGYIEGRNKGHFEAQP